MAFSKPMACAIASPFCARPLAAICAVPLSTSKRSSAVSPPDRCIGPKISRSSDSSPGRAPARGTRAIDNVSYEFMARCQSRLRRDDLAYAGSSRFPSNSILKNLPVISEVDAGSGFIFNDLLIRISRRSSCVYLGARDGQPARGVSRSAKLPGAATPFEVEVFFHLSADEARISEEPRRPELKLVSASR